MKMKAICKGSLYVCLTALCLVATQAAHSAVVTLVGDGNEYDVFNQGAWDATSEPIWGDWVGYGDQRPGSDGFLFFGKFDGTSAHSQLWGTHVSGDMSPHISIGQGANFRNIAYGLTGPPYGSIHDPRYRDQAFVRAGVATSNVGAQDAFHELITFTLSPDLWQTAEVRSVRVGLMGGIEHNADGRWHPTAYRISDGINSATVNNLQISHAGGEGLPSWVFFDITSPGTYSVYGQQRLGSGGASLGGITFDVQIIPEPGTAILLAAGLLLLICHRSMQRKST